MNEWMNEWRETGDSMLSFQSDGGQRESGDIDNSTRQSSV